jgi:hypothetical protein
MTNFRKKSCFVSIRSIYRLTLLHNVDVAQFLFLVPSVIRTKQTVKCGHVKLLTVTATEYGIDQMDVMNLIVNRRRKRYVQTMSIRVLISIRH